MDTKKLIEYASKAKELEAAIYTQTQLMAKHKRIIDKKQPIAPTKKEIEKPKEPLISDYVSSPYTFEGYGFFIVALIIGLPLMLFIFSVLPYNSDRLSTWILLIISIVAVLVGALGLKEYFTKSKERNSLIESQTAKYNIDLKNYPQELAAYYQKARVLENEYAQAFSEYQQLSRQHSEDGQAMMLRHEEALDSLKQTLLELYNQNIIFPKYRNFVAVSAISEYLQSGRCYALEGPDGAYNLYEMELRQNIVIGQLGSIVENLEQIRSNQFSLYEELTKSNELIHEIISELSELNESTKLNTYFAGISVKIAAAPKVIHGIIH